MQTGFLQSFLGHGELKAGEARLMGKESALVQVYVSFPVCISLVGGHAQLTLQHLCAQSCRSHKQEVLT